MVKDVIREIAVLETLFENSFISTLKYLIMAKETYYFPHDYEPTSDPKIQAMLGQYGATGYGLYWRIIEMLHSDNTHQLPTKKFLILAIAKQMNSSTDFILQFIDDCVNIFELLKQ